MVKLAPGRWSNGPMESVESEKPHDIGSIWFRDGRV